MVPSGLFIQALNEMIDDHAKRLAALRNRVPNVVLLGLFGIAAVVGGFAGYASGRDTKRTRLPVYMMGFLVATVILLIFDLDRPNTAASLQTINNRGSIPQPAWPPSRIEWHVANWPNLRRWLCCSGRGTRADTRRQSRRMSDLRAVQNIPFGLARGIFGAIRGAEFFGSPTTCNVSQCSIALPSASIL